MGCGDDGALDEAGTGGEVFCTVQVEGGVAVDGAGLKAHRLLFAGIPDAEPAVGAAIFGGAGDLVRGAVAADEQDGVDVAFVEAAQDEIGTANGGKDFEQSGVGGGVRREAEAAVGEGQGGAQEAEFGKAIEVGDGQ